MIKPFAISLIIIALACSNSMARETIEKITASYDNNGRLKQYEIEKQISEPEPFTPKADADVRSDKPWPAWNSGLCPHTIKYFNVWVDRGCLSCHRPDRTMRGRR